MGKAKKFLPSEQVEIQRDVGKPWELATYRAPCWGPGAEPTAGGPMKGWHRIDLDRAGTPRYIDTRHWHEVREPSEHTKESWSVLVPSSRLRKPRVTT